MGRPVQTIKLTFLEKHFKGFHQFVCEIIAKYVLSFIICSFFFSCLVFNFYKAPVCCWDKLTEGVSICSEPDLSLTGSRGCQSLAWPLLGEGGAYPGQVARLQQGHSQTCIPIQGNYRVINSPMKHAFGRKPTHAQESMQIPHKRVQPWALTIALP